MAIQERQGTNTNRRTIGYFCHYGAGRKHIGGILVTNQIGVPLEFKYTEPVATTKLHQILYGASLERYLHESVIRDRLGQEIKSEPDYFITGYDEREFLGPIAGKQAMAVQAVQPEFRESGGPFTRLRESEALVDLEEGPSLRLAFSTPDDAVQRNMVMWLHELSRTMDVLEPIERIVKALKMLCEAQMQA